MPSLPEYPWSRAGQTSAPPISDEAIREGAGRPYLLGSGKRELLVLADEQRFADAQFAERLPVVGSKAPDGRASLPVRDPSVEAIDRHVHALRLREVGVLQ